MTYSGAGSPSASTTEEMNVKKGQFDVIDDVTEYGPVRWLRIQSGGNPEHFGDGYLALSCATHALHSALELLGVGPKFGPAPVALVFPHAQFEQLRDALVNDCEPGARMFKRPQRKRVDPNKLVTMLGGITIMSDRVDLSLVNLERPRCPQSTARGGAK